MGGRKDEGCSFLCANGEPLEVLFLWVEGWGTSFKFDACSNNYSDAFSLPDVVPRPPSISLFYAKPPHLILIGDFFFNIIQKNCLSFSFMMHCFDV